MLKHDYTIHIWSLFKAKKKYGAPMKPSELFCFKDTIHFEALYAYDANKSTRRLVEDRMNTKLPSTQTCTCGFSLFCIAYACSLQNNAFSVLHYIITVTVLYLNCYIDSRFFLPLEQSRLRIPLLPPETHPKRVVHAVYMPRF